MVRQHVTSSMRYTLYRPRDGAYCTLSSKISGVIDLGARSGVDFDEIDKRPSSNLAHAAHTPHGLELTPAVSQFKDSQDARNRGLADAAGSGEQKCVVALCRCRVHC